jgi:hypothetical protein
MGLAGARQKTLAQLLQTVKGTSWMVPMLIGRGVPTLSTSSGLDDNPALFSSQLPFPEFRFALSLAVSSGIKRYSVSGDL